MLVKIVTNDAPGRAMERTAAMSSVASCVTSIALAVGCAMVHWAMRRMSPGARFSAAIHFAAALMAKHVTLSADDTDEPEEAAHVRYQPRFVVEVPEVAGVQ